MSIPRLVSKQAEVADNLQKQIQDESVDVQDTQDENTEENTDVVVENPVPDQAPVEAVPVNTPQPVEDFEHKYRVLKGKYDAEVPRLQDQIRQLNSAIQDIQQKVAQPETPKESVVSPDEINEYGEDLFKFIRKVVQSEVSDKFNRYDQQVENLSSRQVVSERDRFKMELTRLVPDWEKVDQDQRFLNWLGEVDPLVGRARQELLNESVQTLNVQRTANFFKTWLSMNSEPAPQQNKGLERHVVPPRNSGANSDPVPDVSKPIIPASVVNKFYKDVALGKIVGQEAARQEKIISDALQEGRVR